MNKIKIVKNEVVNNDFISVNEKIVIKPNNNLFIELEDRKDIVIEDNSNAVINEIITDTDDKNSYLIEIGNNSSLSIIKGYFSNGLDDNVKILLNGENSSIDYKLICFNSGNTIYNIECSHLYPNSKSNIVCNGISIKDYSLKFNIVSEVKRGIKNCDINQQSKIRTFGNGKCEANPILKIDEMDVIAHHAASIGRFSDEEIFYLKSRGLNQRAAIKLLIGGFFNEIINEMNDDLKNKFLTLIDSGVKKIE